MIVGGGEYYSGPRVFGRVRLDGENGSVVRDGFDLDLEHPCYDGDHGELGGFCVRDFDGEGR